jgi:predicted O-methyltransferase YrrM
MFATAWRRLGNRPAAPTARYRHADTALTLNDTATDQRFTTPFRPTFSYPGDFINAEHAAFATCPTRDGMIDIGIDGWLLPADAQKLYEIAYFSPGDVLELGTFRGLSTSVLLRAAVAAGHDNKILSIDLDPLAQAAGRAGADRVVDVCFIDHSHRYEHVLSACRVLHHTVRRGGFCLFHDYNDPRNASTDHDDYGVWQGVNEGLDRHRFEFWGVFGCLGLFRRV